MCTWPLVVAEFPAAAGPVATQSVKPDLQQQLLPQVCHGTRKFVDEKPYSDWLSRMVPKLPGGWHSRCDAFVNR
eukprot:398721-Pyramimonas_sp.AAC.1